MKQKTSQKSLSEYYVARETGTNLCTAVIQQAIDEAKGTENGFRLKSEIRLAFS